MLAIEVEFLTGQYVATYFNDRTKGEWPPHPARLFAAMVATWADADEPSDNERTILRVLELFGAPVIRCDAEPSHRSIVTHFVPDNDVRAFSRDLSGGYSRLNEIRDQLRDSLATSKDRTRAEAKLVREEDRWRDASSKAGASDGKESRSQMAEVLAVLPDERGKQGRFYPTVVPAVPTVRFEWTNELSPDQLDTLDKLVARVWRLGHSSSLVSCRVVRDDNDALPSGLEPSTKDRPGRTSLAIRVPRAGMFDRLVLEFARHHGSEPRVTPAATATYVPIGQPKSEPVRSNLAGEMIVIPWTAGSRPPSIGKTLALTQALRGALQSHGPQPLPQVLSGHRLPTSSDAVRTKTAPLEQPHAAFIALPWVLDEHADGQIQGLAIVLPTDHTPEDDAAVRAALQSFAASGGELRSRIGKSFIATEGKGRRGAALFSDRWTREAQVWATVTPIALDGYTDSLDEAAAMIAESCGHVGLPHPIEVRVDRQPFIRGTTHVRDFPGFRSGPDKPKRVSVHARLSFDKAIAGPVLVGAGRYFGYGLCAPLVAKGAK